MTTQIADKIHAVLEGPDDDSLDTKYFVAQAKIKKYLSNRYEVTKNELAKAFRDEFHIGFLIECEALGENSFSVLIKDNRTAEELRKTLVLD